MSQKLPTLVDLVKLWAEENVSDRYVVTHGHMYSNSNLPILMFYDKNHPRGSTPSTKDFWVLTLGNDIIWTPYEDPVNLHCTDPEFFEKLTVILDKSHTRRMKEATNAKN